MSRPLTAPLALWLAMGWALAGCELLDTSPRVTTQEDRTTPTPPTSVPEDTDTGTPVDPCTIPVLTLGTGEETYERLNPSDPVVMVHGPQGGWHVGVSTRVSALQDLVSLAPTIVVVSSGQQLAGDQPETYATLQGIGNCTGQHVGLRAFLDDPAGVDQAFICGLADEELELRLRVTDVAAGTVVQGALRVVASLDRSDVDSCVER